MDLIERQAAIDAIVGITNRKSLRELYEYVVEHDLKDRWSGGLVDATDAVIGLPSADAVEVVRCKDCKSFSHGYCKFHDAKFVREDGYCYWGERKDGNGNG